jgi:hypothetical protein
MPEAQGSGSGLSELAQRKRELLLESEINRKILQVEFCQLSLKAQDWKRGLLKAQSIYRWAAPLTGIGLAFYSMKKRHSAAETAERESRRHNGRHKPGKAAYLNLLGPFAAIAARKAFDFWRHAKKRGATA